MATEQDLKLFVSQFGPSLSPSAIDDMIEAGDKAVRRALDACRPKKGAAAAKVAAPKAKRRSPADKAVSPKSPKAKKAPDTGIKATPEQVLAHLPCCEGFVGVADITSALSDEWGKDVSQQSVSKAMKRLLKDGLVCQQGKARGSKYQVAGFVALDPPAAPPASA